MKRMMQRILDRSRSLTAEASELKLRGIAATALLPVSYGLFPLLFLYAQNTGAMTPGDILVPALWAAAFALAGTAAAGFALKSLVKGSLASAAVLFSFFTYGHVLRILPAGIAAGSLPLIAWAAALVAAFVLIAGTKRRLRRLCTVLMQVGVALTLFQAARAGYFIAAREGVRTAAPSAESASRVPADAALPDIYFIVVDSYARQDVMKEIFDFDNSELINMLKRKGFFVPEAGYTNYCQTVFSLGSILNMNYADTLGEFDPKSSDRAPMVKVLKNNLVMKLLKDAGYSTAAFFSGYDYTELTNADVFLKPSGVMNEFENVLLSTTMLPAAQAGEDPAFARHRRMVTYALDKLPRITEVDSPKFVFAHIMSPHPPFVFGENGEPIAQRKYYDMVDGEHYRDTQGGSAAKYIEGYRGQVKYLTRLMKIMIEKLMENSGDRKPVIILQSDHGPGSGLDWESLEKTNIEERMGILLAYYLPGHEGAPEYASISPVNMFRTIFNAYFGARFQMLPVRSYFMRWTRPYEFVDVTDRLGEGDKTDSEPRGISGGVRPF
jgi:hypothetical protein